MPSTAANNTRVEINLSTFSKILIICQSSDKATPGKIAMSGSPLN